jgi:hypothetical protein
VRAAIGITAHLLQRPHAEILGRIGQRDPQAGVILVVARALDFYWLIVEEEALGGIETQRSDSETGLVAIGDLAAGLDLRDQLVEVALFQRPQRRLVKSHLLLKGMLVAVSHSGGWACRPGHGLARGIEDSRNYAYVLRLVRVVLHFGANLHRSGEPLPGCTTQRTNVPHCFTWTGAVLTSQVCR